MKARSLCAVFLVALLTFGVFSPAVAESTVVNSFELEARDISLNAANNTMGVLKKDADKYVLLDAAGNELTTAPYIYMDKSDAFFTVATDEGVNTTGLIDCAGNEVIPMQYGDITSLSDDWIVGVVLVEATADNYDYKSFWGGGVYLVGQYDLYFKGALVGTLERMAYDYATVYGSFIFIKDRSGAYTAYDSAMNKSEYEFSYPAEYEDDYKTGAVYHIASNQEAFTATCTLTADDVQRSIWYKDGLFYDLQGNMLFKEANHYSTVYEYKGDYAKVKSGNLYGLIDKEGNEVVPCEYEEINTNTEYFASGYQVVVKDEKIGYVNKEGVVTCPFTYSKSAGNTSSMPFNHIKDLDGSVIMLSAAAGELPVRYKETSKSFSGKCAVFAALNADGQGGVVDLEGNAVIPFSSEFDSVYDFDISDDGTTVIANKGSRMYTVYTLAHGEVAAPAVAEAMVCANCAYAPAEGETPKFCPECGTAF